MEEEFLNFNLIRLLFGTFFINICLRFRGLQSQTFVTISNWCSLDDVSLNNFAGTKIGIHKCLVIETAGSTQTGTGANRHCLIIVGNVIGVTEEFTSYIVGGVAIKGHGIGGSSLILGILFISLGILGLPVSTNNVNKYVSKKIFDSDIGIFLYTT